MTLAIGAGTGDGIAQAGTATTTFTTSAVINSACTATATNLAFGVYSPSSGTALTGNSTISVYCTSGSSFTVALNAGSATGSSFTTRHMANGASLLNYNLYTTAALTTVWGDGTGSTGTVGGTGSGLLSATNETVYGNLPASQDMPVGTYTSTITVTVNY